MTEPTKLTVDAALAKERVNAHNSAVSNMASVLTGIDAQRDRLKRDLEACDVDAAAVRAMEGRLEADPYGVNDDPALYKLHQKYQRGVTTGR